MPSRTKRPTAQRRLAAAARRERTRLGWTQEQAAETAGIAVRHYQKVEEGSVNVTLKTLDQLARAFGLDLVELLRS